jgi:CBS domain containing-hemolysin-like protein
VTIAEAVFALLATTLAALCAAADGAMLALDPDDDLPAPLASLYARRERAHRALAFARLLGQLGAGIGVALVVSRWAESVTVWLLITAALAVLLVGCSESIARSAGDTMGARAATRLLPFVRTLERVLAPVVVLGEVIDRGLQVLMPRRKRLEEELEATAEQFKQVVAAEADVSQDQKQLLNGVFRLAQTEVHEIMVPRVDVVAIDKAAPWGEVVERVRNSEHSRLPVYTESIDNIVGVLYAKDMLPSVLSDEEPREGWATLVRPAVFIPGAKKTDEQLRDFQNTRTHIAIVVDEFGGTAGVITIEDVLEEIVGDIRDEHDEEEASVIQEDGRRFWVSARLTLSELSELLGHDFQREDVSTVGGLVYERLGRVPRSGEEFTLDGFRVVVERVERRRVHRVYFERLPVGAEHAA